MANLALRSRLFRKLLLTSLLLIVTALAAADILITRNTATRERANAERQMALAAQLLLAPLAETDPRGLQAWVARADANSHMRVTVIARDGTVLADSQFDSALMDNHAGRPEVRAALAGGAGTAVRRSATLDAGLSYRAVRAALPGGRGVVLRLAMPLEQVRTAAAEVQSLILRASALAALLSLLIAYFASRAFTRRLQRVQEFARELAQANFSGALPVGADDELGSVAISLRGMAERFREMLARLSEEGARREAILASMVEGVLAVDRELHVTFCNQAFARAANARFPVAEGIPLQQLARDPALLDLLGQVVAQEQPARRRIHLMGAQRLFEVQAAPMGEASGRGAIAILHDITEIDRLERVRKDFVANVSHELRTPLTAIRGYAETLLDGALEDPRHNRKFLEIICAHTVRLGDMASDLLALCELEADRGALPVGAVPVGEVVKGALQTVESEASKRSIALSAADCGDLKVAGQRHRVEHALVNLLANAIRFNRPGGRVRVDAEAVDGRVRIRVSDTGIGIPSTDLSRIFERFYCVDKARSRETGGTGLGLAIVKHICERMGGAVSVESQQGKGSVFTLTLPAA